MSDIAFLTERMRLGFGVDLVVDQVATGLVERGHDVTVYASYEDGTYGHRPYRLERLGVPAMRYAPLYDLEARRRARIAGLASKPHDVFFVETQPFFSRKNSSAWRRGATLNIASGSTSSDAMTASSASMSCGGSFSARPTSTTIYLTTSPLPPATACLQRGPIAAAGV